MKNLDFFTVMIYETTEENIEKNPLWNYVRGLWEEIVEIEQAKGISFYAAYQILLYRCTERYKDRVEIAMAAVAREYGTENFRVEEGKEEDIIAGFQY